MTPREAMIAALRPALNSYLRPLGFKGSFPHFRCETGEQVRLITFQFYSSGGSFVVEVADCSPHGILDQHGQVRRPANKATAHDVFFPRPRLGSATFPDGDHWFGFGRPNYEPWSDKVEPTKHYEAVAADVVRHLEGQAEPFWASRLEERRQGVEPSRY